MLDSKTTINGEQTANNGKTSAKKKSAKRSAIGATNEGILNFIMKRAPYECDAIRVAITAMREKRDMYRLTVSEKNILNRYLDEGLVKGVNNTPSSVRKHRQKKAGELVTALSDFLEKKGDIAVASALLSDFACDDDLVNKCIQQLSLQDAGGTNKVAGNWQQSANQSANNGVKTQ